MEQDLEDDYVEESIKSIRILLGVVRTSPMPDQNHVEGLISWIRFGLTSGKFTLEEVGTSIYELHQMSRIVITH